MEVKNSLKAHNISILIRTTLLLSLAFPVYFEPLIHGEPPVFFAILKSGWPLTIMVLAFLLTALWNLFTERGDRCGVLYLTIS